MPLRRDPLSLPLADTFNALARGLALLAHCPGGVSFAGPHWCTESHPQCPNIRTATKETP